MNDIEDVVNTTWTPYSVAMPPIPVECVDRPEPCPRCVAKEPSAGAANTEAVSSAITRFSYPWSLTFWRTWQSFLFGRYSATMGIIGHVDTFGPNVDFASWPNTGINFWYSPPPPQPVTPQNPTGRPRWVTTPQGGDTGVTDLDAMSFSFMSGGLWSGNLRFPLNMRPWAWCNVGYPGARIRIDGSVTGPTTVDVDYPVSWTPLVPTLAELVRNQFRSAVVTAASN